MSHLRGREQLVSWPRPQGWDGQSSQRPLSFHFTGLGLMNTSPSLIQAAGRVVIRGGSFHFVAHSGTASGIANFNLHLQRKSS